MKISRLTGGIVIVVIVLIAVIFLVVRNLPASSQLTPTSTATSTVVLVRTDLPVAPIFDRTSVPSREAPQRPTQTSFITPSSTAAVSELPSSTGTSTATPSPSFTPTQTASITYPVLVTQRPPALTTATQGPPASFGFTLLYLTSSGHAGSSAQATIKTAPGTSCSIMVTLPRGTVATAPGLSPVTAGVDGVCSWFWGIPPSTVQGTGYVTISANGQTQSFVLFIQ